MLGSGYDDPKCPEYRTFQADLIFVMYDMSNCVLTNGDVHDRVFDVVLEFEEFVVEF